jgi:hypothetical protein
MVARGKGHDRQDFIDEAPSFILGPQEDRPPRIAIYRPEEGQVEALLRTMLSRAWVSRIRRDKPTLPLVADAPEHKAQDWAALLAEPFPTGELRQMAGWNALDRVLLLCLTGLWLKLPQEVWRDWVARCGLTWPFPPKEFLCSDKPRLWLAEALGMTTQQLYRRWHRKHHLLTEIQSLRDWFGHDPETGVGRT